MFDIHFSCCVALSNAFRIKKLKHKIISATVKFWTLKKEKLAFRTAFILAMLVHSFKVALQVHFFKFLSDVATDFRDLVCLRFSVSSY